MSIFIITFNTFAVLIKYTVYKLHFSGISNKWNCLLLSLSTINSLFSHILYSLLLSFIIYLECKIEI